MGITSRGIILPRGRHWPLDYPDELWTESTKNMLGVMANY